VAERSYAARLRSVARAVQNIIEGFAHDGFVDQGAERYIRHTLERYAEQLRPWAESVSRYMLADVERRNLQAWKRLSKDMGRSLRAEIEQAPTGMVFQALMSQQVELIQSLPRKAAQRVHALVQEGLVDSRRADEIAKMIRASGKVTASRATLIARTEVARAASSFTQARAMYAGSEGYIWRTSEDGAVRPTHKAQNGKYVRWDDPPQTDKGLAPYHAGCGPNCRCFPDPVLPDFNL
jgi:SPP1 gp7 family putative phage head morphogenesis protein